MSDKYRKFKVIVRTFAITFIFGYFGYNLLYPPIAVDGQINAAIEQTEFSKSQFEHALIREFSKYYE